VSFRGYDVALVTAKMKDGMLHYLVKFVGTLNPNG
jgi:hypothetical protein